MRANHARTSVSVVALFAFEGLTATSALAVCNAGVGNDAGPPSISATETSTSHVLEQVEKRQDDQTASFESAALDLDTETQASSGGTSSGSSGGGGSGSSSAQASKPKPKKVAKAPAAQQETPVYTAPPPVNFGGWVLRKGAWAQIYAERQEDDDTNIGPANVSAQTAGPPGGTLSNADTTVSRTDESVGFMLGYDWTYLKSAPFLVGYQFGVFGGYNDTESRYSDGFFAQLRPTAGNANNEEFFERTNAKENLDGSFWGGYAAYFYDKTTLDIAFKVDFFDLDSKFTTRKLFCANEIEDRAGSVDQTDYIIAANAAYRFDLSPKWWIEPLAGFRYTIVDYSNSEGSLRLGAENGEIFRIQGGARIGTGWTAADGKFWTLQATTLLYSDVSIDGFATVKTAADGTRSESVTLNEEDKLRALGQLAGSVTLQNGLSLIGQLDGAVGEDYHAYGGRLGIRMEW